MQQTIDELKEMIGSGIDLGGVDLSRCGEDTPLFTEQGLGLDSLDAVELIILLQKRYGIAFENMHQAREMFQTLGALAQYVEMYRKK